MSKTLLEELKTTVKKASASMKEDAVSGTDPRIKKIIFNLRRELGNMPLEDFLQGGSDDDAGHSSGQLVDGTFEPHAEEMASEAGVKLEDVMRALNSQPWYRKLKQSVAQEFGDEESESDNSSDDDNSDGSINNGDDSTSDDTGPSSVEDLVDSYKDKLSDKGIEVSATGNTLSVTVPDEDSKDDEDLKALLDQFHDGAWEETDDGLKATFTYGAESEALQETATTKDIEGSYFKWIEGPNKNSKDFEEHWKSFIQGMAYKLDPKTLDAAKPGAAKLYKANMGSSGATPGFKKDKDTF